MIVLPVRLGMGKQEGKVCSSPTFPSYLFTDPV
jgi:hypothetical protein